MVDGNYLDVVRLAPGEYTVASEFEVDKHYVVKAVGGGFECSCPDFVYRGRDCKHVRRLQEYRDWVQDYSQAEDIDVRDTYDHGADGVVHANDVYAPYEPRADYPLENLRLKSEAVLRATRLLVEARAAWNKALREHADALQAAVVGEPKP